MYEQLVFHRDLFELSIFQYRFGIRVSLRRVPISNFHTCMHLHFYGEFIDETRYFTNDVFQKTRRAPVDYFVPVC